MSSKFMRGVVKSFKETERAGKRVCGSRVVPTGKGGSCDGINDLSDHKTDLPSSNAATSSIILNRNSSLLQS